MMMDLQMVAIVHLYLVLWCGESCIYWDGYKHKIGKLKLKTLA